MVLLCVVHDGGRPRLTPSGMPESRFMPIAALTEIAIDKQPQRSMQILREIHGAPIRVFGVPRHAKANGEVLVEHCPGDGLTWIEVPPFTAELEYAESLLPEGL